VVASASQPLLSAATVASIFLAGLLFGVTYRCALTHSLSMHSVGRVYGFLVWGAGFEYLKGSLRTGRKDLWCMQITSWLVQRMYPASLLSFLMKAAPSQI
jgi:hypothetical protein